MRRYVVFGVCLLVALLVAGNVNANKGSTDEEIDELAEAMTKDLRSKCYVSEKELLAEGLTKEDIKKVRKFCNLPKEELKNIIKERLKRLKTKMGDKSIITGCSNSYSCWTWYGGYNWGIPNYEDLGLTSSTCSWHDPNPLCKVEAKIACLWGCTNSDPVLGWHTKQFPSQSALENEIYAKGYHQTASYIPGYQNDYTRGISYGYRYEVAWSPSTKTAHSEGPEPNPEANWYGFLHGFWPEEVYDWHNQC